MNQPIKYRKLRVTDFEAYVRLREIALARNSEAFYATNKEEGADRKQRFQLTMKDAQDFICGAFDRSELIGICGFMRHKQEKLKHKGLIWGVFLLEPYRGKAIAENMIKLCIDTAFEQSGLDLIQLGVGTYNKPAIRCYEKLGFVSFGTEKGAMFENGKYIDELLMVRFKDQRT